MPTIESRGPYQYRAKIRRKGFKNVSKTFNSRKGAEKWARAIEADMDKGAYISAVEAENTTMETLFNRYEKNIFPRLSGK